MPTASLMVGTYATALKMKMADKMEEELMRKVPEKVKQRRNHTVHFGDEELPPIPTSKTTMTANTEQERRGQVKATKATPTRTNISRNSRNRKKTLNHN
eukprot:scaffold20826_cov73-Attheya_sp.AAC.2